MKNALLTAALVALASVTTFAQGMPGAITKHALNCTAPATPNGSVVAGVGYSMECFTQALAPQYSLRGCNLYSRVVYPNAKRRLITLKQVNQTAEVAQLASVDGSIRVVVDKTNISAQVQFANSARMSCSNSN